MPHEDIWLGMARLALAPTNPERSKGFIGAYAGFACRAASIVKALEAVSREFEENGYALIGVEDMLPVDRLDRQLTAYESKLVEAVDEYPVQFKNVHLHPGDG